MIEKQIDLKKNFRLNIIRDILYSVPFNFSTGSIVQAFLLALGLSAGMVATYVSILTTIQTCVMVLISFVCDRFKKIKLVITIAYAIVPIFFIGLLLCYLPSLNVSGIYAVALITGMAFNFALAFINTISYKFTPCIMDMNDYGKCVSIIGVVANSLAIGVSLLVSFLVARFDYFNVMLCVFATGAVLWIISAIICALLKVKKEEDIQGRIVNENNIEEKISILKYPLFLKLIPANILRGVALAIIGYAVVIGTYEGLLNSELSVHLTTATMIATVLGTFLFAYLNKKQMLFGGLIFSAVAYALLLPTLMIFGVYAMFAIFSLITIVKYACSAIYPTIVYKYIPFNLIGRYSSWRMMLTTLGQAVVGFVLEPLLNTIGSFWLLSIGAVCMVFCCLSYVFVFKKEKTVLE